MGGHPGGTAAADRRRVGRGPLIGVLAAAILAAGIGGGLAALLSHPGGSGPGAGAIGATRSPSAAATKTATALRRSTASARPSPSPDPAACVTGSWRSVNQQFTASINGQQILFTGSGAQAILRTDGTGTTFYDGTVFSADVNGVDWTQTFQGTTTGHWAVKNGDILFSAVSSAGTVVLRDDGLYNNSGPLESQPGAVPYECSGNTPREYFPNGGSDELIRETPS